MTPSFNTPITGSYTAEDCVFLLKPLDAVDTPVAEKERLIQSGQKHYSELISHEKPVSTRYRELFLALTERYKTRLAQDVLDLAQAIQDSRPAPITLVSLARAGTPIGALLQRAMTRLGVSSRHYSISIIRDRGIDERALVYILRHERRPPAGVVFVDGWTAKGVITAQLRHSIAGWNRSQRETLDDALHVIADLSGNASVAATADDYAIPCGILGATVSGLVSRSILNEAIEPNDFHGCVVYDHLRPHDLSGWFLDTISKAMEPLSPRPLPAWDADQRRHAVAAYLATLRREFGIAHLNYIKPGVLEASRVLLRRVPDRLILRADHDEDVAHLKVLAAEKGVAIDHDPTLPFNAVALIQVLD